MMGIEQGWPLRERTKRSRIGAALLCAVCVVTLPVGGTAHSDVSERLHVPPLADAFRTGGDPTVPGISGVAPRQLPGPAVLRRPAASSPQLSNGHPWRAQPLLVSGTSAYRSGEFVYQDFLYDDRGAGTTSQAPGAPSASGTFAYPTDPKYADNAADLLELRAKMVRGALLVRISYNTMLDPDLVATTLAFGGDTASIQWPHGAKATSPAEVFVTVHGRVAEVVWASDAHLPRTLREVTVDLRRRQVEVRVPFSVFDPRGGSFRMAAASGLWDSRSGMYRSRAASADHDKPGGSTGGGSELVNVAFRFAEPQSPTNPWREAGQAAALTRGDLSGYFAMIDVRRIARDGAFADPRRPRQTGFLNRIVVSHYEEKQGRGGPGAATGVGCGGGRGPCDYSGRLQPYAVFVPKRPGADGRYGLVLDLHNANQNHNVRLGTDHVRAMADDGYMVVTPGGRGPTYWYDGLAHVDVWEVLADVLRRYPVARERITIGGTSMGGYGAYKLAATFPGVFGAAALIVPCTSADVLWPGEPTDPPSGRHTIVRRLMPSMLNVPVMSWTGAADELCGYTNERAVHEELVRLGYRTSFWTFAADHMTLSAERRPLANFLHTQRVPLTPSRVNYVVRDRDADRRWGLTGTRAYWLGGFRVRPTEVDGEGSVSARSFGRGERMPALVGTSTTTGTLQPASSDLISVTPTYPYAREDQSWVTSAAIRARDLVEVRARGLSAMTLNLQAAGVSCGSRVRVDSDGPMVIRWPGCPGRPTAYLSARRSTLY